MNINFTPAIKKTVLGGMAALAVAGGVMVSCQNNTKTTETDNEKLERTLDALSNANKISAENVVMLDSILSKITTDSIEAHKELKED